MGGMPACRISDTTAHGGTILVGYPQVLIGNLPASRIGDMHECPMQTPGLPPIPHVGGPFILGSPTVIVGEVPQSRVTDELTCVGPPDVAVAGELTVLVGMAGGAGATAAADGVAAMGVAVPVQSASSNASAASTQSSSQAQTTATRQPDGSTQTASTSSKTALPPMQLKQPGWPDLAPENTATFQSVKPAIVPQGTTLYATGDGTEDGTQQFWSTTPPAGTASQGENAATHVSVFTVTQPAGLKAWAGQPAGGSAVTQVCARPHDLKAAGHTQRFRLPPAGASR